MNRFFIKILCLVTALVALWLFVACDGLIGAGGEIRNFNDYNGTWACDELTVTSDVRTEAYICGKLRLDGADEKDLVIREILSSYLRFYDREKWESPKGYADVTAKLFDGEVTFLNDDSLKIKVVADYMYDRGETTQSLEGKTFTLPLKGNLNKDKISYQQLTATWSGEGMTIKSAPGEEIAVSGTFIIDGKKYSVAIKSSIVYDLDTAEVNAATGKINVESGDQLLNINVSVLSDYSLQLRITRDFGYYSGKWDTSLEGVYVLRMEGADS